MSDTAAIRTLIVGLGNPLRGDDALGKIATDRLRQVLRDPTVRVCARQQLLPDLASDLAEVETAIIIDASVALSPGEISSQPIVATEDSPAPTAHQLELADLLALTQNLFGRVPDTYLIAVGVETLDLHDEQLSSPVSRAVPEVVAETLRLLGSHAATKV